MNGFTFGPTGGRGLSRKRGTQVMLAGRTAFLPNEDVPCVRQMLTMRQINAIPKDRFSVSLEESSTPTATTGPVKKGFRQLLKGKTQRIRRQAHPAKRFSAIRFVRNATGSIAIESENTKLYHTIVKLAKQTIKTADDMYDVSRRLRRNPGGDPPSSDIFYKPIDEGKLSDCIKKIIVKIFGDGDKGKICDREIKLVEFCLMMHYYFIRIKILKNTSRQPFCDYLEKYVFPDESKFTSKTFNNYANDDHYKKFAPIFTDESRLYINFKFHPTPDGTLKDFFHEIGCFFYNSPYFDELRDMQKNINNFKI